MPSAAHARQVLRRRAREPVVMHSAPLMLPIAAEPLRDAAVVVRGGRVLQVGPRIDLLARFPVTSETRWDGMIVAGLVDAFASGPAAPGVTSAASMVADLGEEPELPGITYIEVTCPSEEAWESNERDALITAIREVDHPGAIGIAAHSPDLQVLEDVAVLARTFGLRLLVDLERHSPATLDEAGALGPHCHVICSGQLDPGERKLLRLRRATVAINPDPPRQDDALALLDDGDRIALGGCDLLGSAAAIRAQARLRGVRLPNLDVRLVEAATLGGGMALGMDQGPGRIGTLGPGSRADFAVFDARGRYPHAALLDNAPCLATAIAGHITTYPAKQPHP